MNRDYGKAICLVALLFLMGVSLALTNNEQTAPEAVVVEEWQNPNTRMKKLDDDTLYIGGEGKLYYRDISKLYKKKKIKSSNIKNVIFGDGVTEICYNLYNRSRKIVTIKLGRNVRVVHEGAIHKCGALQYVFVPKDIQRVGRGFGLDCAHLYIVTDGRLDEMIEFENVPRKRILEDVHSYDDLVARRAAVKDKVFAADALLSDDPEPDSDPRLLRPGFYKTSPGMSLGSGTYTLKYVGHGLDGLSEGSVALFSADTPVAIQSTAIEENSITCKVVLETAMDELNLRVTNTGTSTLEIDEMDVYDENYELPAALKNWWQEQAGTSTTETTQE